MIGATIGFIIGGIAGFFLCAVLVASDEGGEK